MLGIGNLAKLVFGTPNDRKVKSVRPLVAQINALEGQFQALDDEALRAKTAEDFYDDLAWLYGERPPGAEPATG